MNIGKELRNLRKVNRLSLEELASRIGISIEELKGYENTIKPKIPQKTIKKFSTELGFDIPSFNNNEIVVPDNLNLTLGETIEKARINMKYTYADISEVTGLSTSTIYNYEKDKVKKHKSSILVAIANAPNVDVELFASARNYQVQLDNNTSPTKELGSIIYKYRIKRNLSLSELGAKVNLTSSAISSYENARVKKIKESRLLQIADVLNIPFKELGLTAEANSRYGDGTHSIREKLNYLD